jgi:hypothetical protein
MAKDGSFTSDVFAPGTDENLKIENLGYQQGMPGVIELSIGKY